MNIFQKFVYNLFREVMNPYFEKHPGAMLPILFSFENSIKKAGFSEQEIIIFREEFNKNK
jgi:hypothetical protein